MNTPHVSDSSKGIMWSFFGSRKSTEVSDTPDISGFSNREVPDTHRGSGSSKEEVCTHNVSGSRGTESWHTHNISGDRGTKPLHTHNVSGSKGTEVLERQCKDSDPRKMTAEDSRYSSDTSQQPSAYQEQASIMKEMFETMKEMFGTMKEMDNKKMKEMFEIIKEMDNRKTKEMSEMIKEMDNKKMKEMFEMMKEMDNKNTKKMFEIMKEMDNKNTKEMFEMMKEMDNKNMKEMFEMVKKMDNKIMAIPERVIQIHHQKEEEIEMLKKEIKKLEARNQELLAKAMAMHQYSEDINDPLRLSALLERYEMLRLREWEKVRSSTPYPWSYEEGSRIIRRLFDVCEKDIQQRTNYILKVLDFGIPLEFPVWNDALTKVMMQTIMKLFRQLYHQNLKVYNKIIQEAAIHIRTESEEQFLLQCCQIYCLLLLQDPPVKAEWKINRSYSEHVDKKDVVNWRKASFLWPIMKRGEEIIVKGVVWEQRKMN